MMIVARIIQVIGGGLPHASGYTHGFALPALMCLLVAAAALLVPVRRAERPSVQAAGSAAEALVRVR